LLGLVVIWRYYRNCAFVYFRWYCTWLYCI